MAETLFKSDVSEESQSSSVTVPDTTSKPVATRSGRVVKKPARFKDMIMQMFKVCLQLLIVQSVEIDKNNYSVKKK